MESTIRWGATQTHPILMIPGPTELPFPVVQAMMYVLPTLSAIEMTLRDLGYRSEAGAGVAAAQAVFSGPPA